MTLLLRATGPVNGVLTVALAVAAMTGVLALGRAWLVRRPQRRATFAWLAILLILVVAALASSRAAALGERSDPSAGAVPSLALFGVPVFGLIIAIASMMGACMREITAELESTTRRLKSNLARLNTQQWEQSGRLSRALHGPVQSMLHARLLRLRKELDAGEVRSISLVDLRHDLAEALVTALSPSRPRAVSDVLADVAETWEGVAHVECEVSPAAASMLTADPLCTMVVTDLATGSYPRVGCRDSGPHCSRAAHTSGPSRGRHPPLSSLYYPARRISGRCTPDRSATRRSPRVTWLRQPSRDLMFGASRYTHVTNDKRPVGKVPPWD